jgi:hypothetical protein
MSPESYDFDPEDVGIDAPGCVRCGRPFQTGRVWDAALIAQLMGRDLPEDHRGRAIGACCIEADELRAFAAAKRRADKED